MNVPDFIKASGVEKVLTDLKTKMAGRPMIFSDVSDAAGNQYADLVQEGGGVWGIALVGYTYILEKMGIRFFSLAGTSAGAINTMLMAALGEKEEEKTDKIIQILLDLDMFGFVDGKKDNWAVTRWVKRAIQQFILKKHYLRNVLFAFIFLLTSVVLVSIGTFIAGLFTGGKLLMWLSGIAIFVWLMLIAIAAFIVYLAKKIAKSGYGLNQGRAFFTWMSQVLHKNGIDTLADLKKHFSSVPAGLKVRRDARRDAETPGDVIPPASPMLVIVSSDLTSASKVEFPRMWDLYWEQLSEVNPASFVRASMSIPVFFETYKIPVKNPSAKTAIWKDHLNWNGKIPAEVALVDGGVLSNFPINVFYTAKYIIPRMPTFGIRLGGSGIREAYQINSVRAFLTSLLSTLRGNTDKEFLNKNKAFELGVKEVNLSAYSWLNFFMSDLDKQAIFLKGAQAAAAFLLEFDWEAYKIERARNDEVLEQQRKNPNNW